MESYSLLLNALFFVDITGFRRKRLISEILRQKILLRFGFLGSFLSLTKNRLFFFRKFLFFLVLFVVIQDLNDSLLIQFVGLLLFVLFGTQQRLSLGLLLLTQSRLIVRFVE